MWLIRPYNLYVSIACAYVTHALAVSSTRLRFQARACGLALVLTPTKGREPLPGMAYSVYTECDTLLSLSIMHSCYRIYGFLLYTVQLFSMEIAHKYKYKVLHSIAFPFSLYSPLLY